MGDFRTKELYAAYLQTFEWNYFWTITFKHPRRDSIYTADRIRETMFTASRIPFGKRAFAISEPHTTGDLHYHGLLQTEKSEFIDSDKLARSFKCESERLFGYSRISPIRSMAEVSSYVSKYVTKSLDGDSKVDYFFWDNPKHNAWCDGKYY